MIQSTYGTMYYVDDMKKSISFYKSNLGITPTYESPEWTEFSVGGHNLCLHAKNPGETYTANGVLIFSVDGIKNLFEKMKQEDLNVYNLHEVHPEAWTFNLKDLSGNEVSLYGKP